MTKKELAQISLDAIDDELVRYCEEGESIPSSLITAAATLRAELEKPEPEPAGYFLVAEGNKWVKKQYTQFADIKANNPYFVPLYHKKDL